MTSVMRGSKGTQFGPHRRSRAESGDPPGSSQAVQDPNRQKWQASHHWLLSRGLEDLGITPFESEVIGMNAACQSAWLNTFLETHGGLMTISMRLTTHG